MLASNLAEAFHRARRCRRQAGAGKVHAAGQVKIFSVFPECGFFRGSLAKRQDEARVEINDTQFGVEGELETLCYDGEVVRGGGGVVAVIRQEKQSRTLFRFLPARRSWHDARADAGYRPWGRARVRLKHSSRRSSSRADNRRQERKI